MNRVVLTAAFLLAVCLLTLPACETTGDPKQGGLFGWSETKAQQRIEQKEQQKSTLEQEQAAEQAKTAGLEQQKELATADRNAMAAKVNELNKEVLRVERSINNAKVATEDAKLRQWELSTQLKAVKRELTDVSDDPDTVAKQQEIKRLEAELDRLLKEAETLSTL